MKILVGQNHLNSIGGSETYTYTLIKGLIKKGHTVELLVGDPNALGIMSKKIKEDFDVDPNVLTGGYDACFLSHKSSVSRYVSGKQNLKNVFQIIHGTTPDQEQPVKKSGIKYIAVSREIQNYLRGRYDLDSEYVSNFIDLERFAYKPSNPELKKIFSLSQDKSFNGTLSEISKKIGVEFGYNNKNINPVFDIQDKIQQADLVVSLGRGCYEAMACGKNVVVSDRRGYIGGISDGYLTDENYLSYHQNNCSGRTKKTRTTKDFLIQEFGKYDPSMGVKLRAVAEKYLDMDKNCDKLISLIDN